MPRKPRWSRRPDERPQDLLDAALEVFTRVGYRAARLDDVAEAAGVTKGTVYYYFRDKEELLSRALTARVDATFADISAVAAGAQGSAADRFRAVLRAAWDRWTDSLTAKLQRLVMGEIRLEYPRLFQRTMQNGPLLLAGLIARILEEGKRSGEFAATLDSEGAARFVVMGTMQQAMLLSDARERGGQGPDAERLFDACVSTVLHGALARDGTPGPTGSTARGSARRPGGAATPKDAARR